MPMIKGKTAAADHSHHAVAGEVKHVDITPGDPFSPRIAETEIGTVAGHRLVPRAVPC